jgi:NAD(P)-dependent dehydrogenase (short-subunit alcohol dehydrogenase family)
MDLGLAGQVAVVTGASTGIGRATVIALSGEGVAVVGASRRAPGEAVHGASHLEVDLAEPSAPAMLIDHAVRVHGRLDILVNNAALGMLSRGVLDEGDDAWARTLELNLLAAVRTTRAAIPHLLARGGAIVNVTSVNGRVPSPQAAAYSASKAALLIFGKAVASEYVGQGIRVVTVSPGLTATPMWLGDDGIASQIAALDGGDDAAAVAASTAASTPLSRFLTPEEIASCICFVASPRASAVTGTELVVDGGLTDTM